MDYSRGNKMMGKILLFACVFHNFYVWHQKDSKSKWIERGFCTHPINSEHNQKPPCLHSKGRKTAPQKQNTVISRREIKKWSTKFIVLGPKTECVDMRLLPTRNPGFETKQFAFFLIKSGKFCLVRANYLKKNRINLNKPQLASVTRDQTSPTWSFLAEECIKTKPNL